MYAIIEVKGKQYKVEKGSKIQVDLVSQEENPALPEIKTLLVVDDDAKVSVGTPYVDSAKVKATLGDVEKGEKVVIYKYKKRKDYHKKQGHRQKYHALTIEDISAS